MDEPTSSKTLIAQNERCADSGAGLIGKRIEIVCDAGAGYGAGNRTGNKADAGTGPGARLKVGKVVDMRKSMGKATKHVIAYDDGSCEVLTLSKDPNNPRSKGLKFYITN